MAKVPKPEEIVRDCRDPLAVYLATEAHLKAIENALCSGTAPRCRDAMAALEAIREAEAVDPDFAEVDGPTPDQVANIERDYVRVMALLKASQERASFLDRACASYIERLAGEKVAGGFMNLAVASAWASEQKALVNAALAHIGEDAP